MESMKKVGAVLLAVAIVLGCCSCSGGKTNNNELEGNTYVAGFPIVKEQEKLEVMTLKSLNHGDFDEMGFTTYYEDMTNIDIEWTLTTDMEVDTDLTLRFQSKNLPDVLCLNTRLGADRLLKYTKSGQIIQLNDLIDKYAPNVKKLLETSPDFKAASTAADGKIYSLPTGKNFSDNHERFPQKLYIRKTWLDNLGLDVPKTADELYEVLKAFKNDDPNGNGQQDEIPLAFDSDITPSFFGSFGISFSYNNSKMCVDDNGKVAYGYATDATKEAVSYFNRLYSLGLCELYDSNSKWTTKVKNGLVGMFYHLADFTAAGTDLADEYVMIEPFAGSKTADPVMSVDGAFISNAFAITNMCENPIAAIRWVDYLYSTDGYFLVTYGQPGDMIEKDKNGEWNYTDYDRSKDRFTFTPGYVLPYYCDDETLSIFNDDTDAEGMTDLEIAGKELSKETKEVYLGKFEPKNLLWMPPYDDQALDVIDSYYDNIHEYAMQMMREFGMGYRNIDTEWDTYIAELNKKGLPLVVAEYQRLYDATH